MVILVGLDKINRETISIITPSEVLFKQISNYNINKIIPIQKEDLMLVTLGYENIRFWKLHPHNGIIVGNGVYLGNMNRGVLYTGAIQIADKIYVCDSKGFITVIDVIEEKVLFINKVGENGIDALAHIP